MRRDGVYTLFQSVSELLFSLTVWFSPKSTVAVRNRLWNSAGFFVVFWLVHYFPFFLMSRQLFIHHYLPSHLASALVAGAVLHFLLSETIEYPISVAGHYTRPRPRQWAEIGARGPAILAGFFIALFVAFVYIAPLTYGTPGYVLPINVSAIGAPDALEL